MIVSKKITFEACHHLPNYDGPCANLHGHHFSVELGLEGNYIPKETGMLLDFTIIKAWLKKNVEEVYDHQNLNDFFETPTAENIGIYIYDKAFHNFGGAQGVIGVAVKFVRVWETENSMVEIS